MAVASESQGDHASLARSRLWEFGWQKRIAIGAIGESKVHCQIWGTNRAQHDHRDSEEARNGPAAGTEPKDDLERIPDLSLGTDRRRRLLHCGIAANANGLWMSQIGRNLTDAVDGLLTGKRYLIHDRDPLFTGEFLGMPAAAGVKSVKLPPRSPNLNAHAERFLRNIKGSMSGSHDLVL